MSRATPNKGIGIVVAFLLFASFVAAQTTIVDPAQLLPLTLVVTGR